MKLSLMLIVAIHRDREDRLIELLSREHPSVDVRRLTFPGERKHTTPDGEDDRTQYGFSIEVEFRPTDLELKNLVNQVWATIASAEVLSPVHRCAG